MNRFVARLNWIGVGITAMCALGSWVDGAFQPLHLFTASFCLICAIINDRCADESLRASVPPW